MKALAPTARSGERWLALTPTAMEELEDWGLPHLLDGDVCTAHELNRIGLDNFPRAEALVEAYDRAIFDQSPVLRQIGLPPLRSHFTRVKFLLDAIAIRIHILQRLFGDGVAEVRKTLPEGPRPKTDSNLFYTAEASLYGDLLGLMATQAAVPVTWVARLAAPPVRSSLRWRPRAAMSRLWEMAQGLTGGPRPMSGGARPRCVLVLSTGYDLGKLSEQYVASGAEVFWLDLSRLELHRLPGRRTHRIAQPSEEVQIVRNEVRRLSPLGPGDPADELCRDGEICYAGLVRRVLEQYLEHTFPLGIAVRAFLEACHRDLGFDLVLSSTGAERIETSAVFDFCRRSEIPISVFQHGGHAYTDNPVTNYFEFGFEGSFLAWGPGVEAHYGVSKKGSVHFLPFGSPTLDTIVKQRDRTAARPRRVMYIITGLRGYSAYFPGGQPWLDTAYYSFQRKVLSLLQKYQDNYDIWLKVPPGFDRNHLVQSPLREWLRSRGARIAVEQRPLVQVINDPSLFLIDCPTTTLAQCLATRAEVIVLAGNPYIPILPEARQLLEQRAVCCETPEEFLETIEAKLREGIGMRASRLDDSFLSRYGTSQHDGKSLERVMAHLHRQHSGVIAERQ